MKTTDPLDLDGHALALLVAVHAEGSITRAAERLGVTQSAVSHGIDRLRALLGDALFVKSGRGIAPTARADALALQAAGLLAGLQRMAAAESFVPAAFAGTVTIAANALQRDLLLPPLFARLRAEAPGLRLRVLPSDAPTAEPLRSGAWHLLLTPRPPDAGDLRHKRVFTDGWRVFFDPAVRAAPRDAAEYLAAEHVTVVYESGRRLTVDDHLAMQGATRRMAVEVASFSAVAPFVRGSERLATMPGRLRGGVLQGLADAAVPLPTPELPMFMAWHERHHGDALHAWLRAAVEAVALSAAG